MARCQHRSVGDSVDCRSDKVGSGMNKFESLERLNYAEMKLDEAIRNSSKEDILYWHGYCDGVRATLRKAEARREAE